MLYYLVCKCNVRSFPDPPEGCGVLLSSLIVAPVSDITPMPKMPSRGKDLLLGAPAAPETQVDRRILI
jgi:hypothetical protein